MVNDAEARLWGLSWQQIRRLAMGAWIAFIPVCWGALFAAWLFHDSYKASLSLSWIAVFIPLACTLIPGIGALLQRRTRAQLLTLPTAAALSSISLAFVIVVSGWTLFSVAIHGAAAFTESAPGGDHTTVLDLASFMLIGIIGFPLTGGIVFPLAIPLVCANIVWSKVNRNGSITRTGWIIAVAVAVLGWGGVILAGIGLGFGG